MKRLQKENSGFSGVKAGTKGNLEFFAEENQNIKERFTEQHETLREFSQEGRNIFRLVLLFVAVPATILGTLSPENIQGLGKLLLSDNCAVIFGAVCMRFWHITITSSMSLLLAVSLNISAAGYESQAVYSFTTPEDVMDTIDNTQSRKEYYTRQMKHSIKRLHHNNQIISTMEKLLAYGKVFLSFSIFLTATLAYAMASDSVINPYYWSLALFSYLILQIYHITELPAEYLASESVSFEPLYDQEEVEEYIDDCSKRENLNSKSGENDI